MLNVMLVMVTVLAGETVERVQFFGMTPTPAGLVAIGVIGTLLLWAGFSYASHGIVHDLFAPTPAHRRVRR